ncbi:MAG TPA: DUF2341 domain-containing protein [Candidatus Acidoferrum sp.]|jgi:hypothetical protein|nr:DUF2341 domain-containing protein [Candidatus Acidoferrum sp.]
MLQIKNDSRHQTISSRLFTVISLKRFGGIALALFAALYTSNAANLSNPQVDAYNVRIGTETFAALYNFTTNTPLVETAQAMTNLGSDVIKLYLGSNASGQEGVTLASNITNLLTLVRDQPSYHQVFNMPFRHIIAWAYPFENSDSWWSDGYNATQGAKDYQEMYSLTQYLLTNYNNSGKTFYLGHWEGDGYLEVNGWTTNPSPVTVQGMIAWLNNRQKAVDDAKAATVYTNVNVFNYAECNRVRDAMLNNSNNNVRVINDVIPYVTNLDYLSYSSYDAQDLSSADLDTTLNYMQAKLPTNKASVVPGERMWIGEYGWGYESTSVQEPLVRAYMQRLMNWNNNGQCLPFILMWEMYSNFNANGDTNYCLINYLDQKVPAWYLHDYFINDAKMLVAQYDETYGELPTDTQFVSLVSSLFNQPLPAPVPLTVANAGATVLTGTSASVSGTLAQGIYGDNEAVVWVYYGTQDGGTTFSAWQHAQYVGMNTNFNPATFTATLSELVSQTNYFFRFYGQNLSTNVWAPASSQFSTVTVNPSSYGSRMQISFPGYNRGEALTNFPALVTFSTNLPGFSYKQFASPNAGDLRFTDGSGYTLIPYEINQWNTNGTSTVWVNVPSLSADTSIWAYWGNSAATNAPYYTTNGAAWPNYDLVWHLEQSGFPYADSTLNYPALVGVAPAQAKGIVGNGQTFNGTSSYLDAGTVANLNNAFTLSAWVNISPSVNNIQVLWSSQKGGYASPGFALFVNAYNTANGAVLLDAGDGSNGSELATAAGAVGFGQWHLVTAAINRTGGTVAFYVDGSPSPVVSGGPVVNDFINNADLNFGRFTNNYNYFTGGADEARIHSGVDDSNWVWASWATVASNSVLESYSAVTQQEPDLMIGTGGGTGPFLVWPGSSVGFGLVTTTNLAPPVSWTTATNQPFLTNNQWEINLPPSTNSVRFYRIQSQ